MSKNTTIGILMVAVVALLFLAGGSNKNSKQQASSITGYEISDVDQKNLDELSNQTGGKNEMLSQEAVMILFNDASSNETPTPQTEKFYLLCTATNWLYGGYHAWITTSGVGLAHIHLPRGIQCMEITEAQYNRILASL